MREPTAVFRLKEHGFIGLAPRRFSDVFGTAEIASCVQNPGPGLQTHMIAFLEVGCLMMLIRNSACGLNGTVPSQSLTSQFPG